MNCDSKQQLASGVRHVTASGSRYHAAHMGQKGVTTSSINLHDGGETVVLMKAYGAAELRTDGVRPR